MFWGFGLRYFVAHKCVMGVWYMVYGVHKNGVALVSRIYWFMIGPFSKNEWNRLIRWWSKMGMEQSQKRRVRAGKWTPGSYGV